MRLAHVSPLRLTQLVLALLLVACSTPQTASPQPLPAQPLSSDLTNVRKTLNSLQQVDDHPLFTMTYYGSYDLNLPQPQASNGAMPAWACSLFVTFADPEQPLFARNFDWQKSPALLLFTDPPDGYASVSMVDISYLGYDANSLDQLTSFEGKQDLLFAPRIPFDGMNETGLAVGMAAVDQTSVPNDPTKPTIGRLRIIRLMLDRAKSVEEAVALFQQYNIDFSGGPPIHYLVADRDGHSAVIEYKDGKLRISNSESPWQVATNFYLADSTSAQRQNDRRYSRLDTVLTEMAGETTISEAMEMLEEVAQPHTRWSIIYGMKTGKIYLATSRRYETVHQFQLSLSNR